MADTNEEVQNDSENATRKKVRRNKCDLGPNFVAPDGGWGWLVVFAAGISNVSYYTTYIYIQDRARYHNYYFHRNKNYNKEKLHYYFISIFIAENNWYSLYEA